MTTEPIEIVKPPAITLEILNLDPVTLEAVVGDEVRIVEVVGIGLPGQRGAPGIGTTYIHTQAAPATVWIVKHRFERWPSVTVVDSSGEVVAGSVVYLDKDTIQITFSAAFGGLAYCN